MSTHEPLPLLPVAMGKLEWMRRYKSARRIAHIVARGGLHGRDDRAELIAWLASQMRAYVETCIGQGWNWSKDCESDRAEMARWIAADLDFDASDLGLSDATQVAIADDLCGEAGWA